MSLSVYLAFVHFAMAMPYLVGCPAQPEQLAAVQQTPLTPELARKALLEMMRTDAGKAKGGWFDGPTEGGGQTLCLFLRRLLRAEGRTLDRHAAEAD
jgi:hypothetical protein